MGMYTELIFGAELKSDTPIDVINTLKYLVGDIEEPDNLLYTEQRNPLMGGSYYFGVNTAVTKMYFDKISNAWVLSSRANIKNYGSEIEKILTVIIDDTGEIWEFGNQDIKATKNLTLGRGKFE